MKKTISRPENKIYLKLITIKKKNTINLEESHNERGSTENLGTKSKQEIELCEIINEDEDEGQDEMDICNKDEESEMVDEAN
jgi:hypothetical protein